MPRANTTQTNSLVRSVYKIMYILLVEKLKRVMWNLVSAQQSALKGDNHVYLVILI